MPLTIAVARNLQLYGAINVVVQNTDAVAYSYRIERVDGAFPAQPVRNFEGVAAGSAAAPAYDYGADAEAPIGRPVTYNVIDLATGAILAQSGPALAGSPPDNLSILRSCLRPSVDWALVEPMDETGVTWGSSTTTHWIPGRSSPVMVSEVRHRHRGSMQFLCKSIAEANRVVGLCADGSLMLIRHAPCAGRFVRDTLFHALDITEVLLKSRGWRRIVVEYQTVEYVYGTTDEPRFSEGWDFGVLNPTAGDNNSLRDSAPDFKTLASLWPNFGIMTILPQPVWGTPREESEEEAQRRRRLLGQEVLFDVG